jgi:hypothetical protein
MARSNFCTNCGAPLTRKGWRAWLRGSLCDDCSLRMRPRATTKIVLGVSILAVSSFAFGRYLRPKPPPLIIERAANSPLSDLPVNFDAIANRADGNSNQVSNAANASADDVVYLCGARTKKGTPCRRRVHTLGERCYQHKGMPAMVPLEKLTIKPDAAKK